MKGLTASHGKIDILPGSRRLVQKLQPVIGLRKLTGFHNVSVSQS